MRVPRSPKIFLMLLVMALLKFSSALAVESVTESESLYAQGLVHFRKEEYDEALKFFKQAVATEEKERHYYLAVYYLGVTYGKCAEKEGRCKEKTSGYTEAIYYFNKTRELIAQKAVKCPPPETCAEPVEKIPGYGPVHQDLGVAYYHTKKYETALENLSIAAQLDPQNEQIRQYQALCHYELGSQYVANNELKKAELQFKQASILAPSSELATRAGEASEKVAEQRRRTKNWELRFSTGADYDSNVVLASDGGPAFGQISHKGDFRTTFSTGLSLGFDLPKLFTRLTGSYDFYQSVYTDLSDFDLQGHLFKVNAMWTPTSSLILGVEGGTNFFRLGQRNYLHEIYGMPFVGYFEGPPGEKRWGYTDISYRATNENYLISFFDPARDGLLQQVSFRQYFLGDGEKFKRYLFVGYQYNDENPSLRVGNDFQYHGHQAEVGGVYTVPCADTRLELTYLFRDNVYSFLNSRAAFLKKRDDEMHSVIFTARQPLDFLKFPDLEFPRVNFKVSYVGTINRSDIGVFQYHRHIGSVGFEVVF